MRLQRDRVGRDGLAGLRFYRLASGAPEVQCDAARAIREFDLCGVLVIASQQGQEGRYLSSRIQVVRCAGEGLNDG